MVSANTLRMQKQAQTRVKRQIAWHWRNIEQSKREDSFAYIEDDLICIIRRCTEISNPSERIKEIERAVAASRMLYGKVREVAVEPWKNAVSELSSAYSKIAAAKCVIAQKEEPFSWLRSAASKVIVDAAPMIHDPMERFEVLKLGFSSEGTIHSAVREQYARQFLELASIFQSPKQQLNAAYLAMLAVGSAAVFTFEFSIFTEAIGEMAAEIVLANIESLKPENRSHVLQTAASCVHSASHVGGKIAKHRRLLAITEQRKLRARSGR